MTVENGTSQPSPSQAEAAAREPSMEDILASIRRIIADDDALPLSRARAAAPEPALQAAPTPPAAAPAPPATKAVDALLGFGQRLFRGSEAAADAPRPPASISAFRPPPPRIAFAPGETRGAVASAPGRAPTLKLRDFALAEVPAPQPSPETAVRTIETASAAEPAPVAEPVKAEPTANTAPKPEAKATTAATAPPETAPAVVETPSAPSPVAQIAEARLKAAPPAPPAEKPPEPSRPAARRIAAPAPAKADAAGEPALLSPASGARIGASFEALTESLMLRDPEMIERVAREVLRPMLKAWLDDNLPVVVERLVRAEIERIARGRG
jgi:uncharacterized protein